MTRLSYRVLGLGLLTVGVAATSVGVANGTGTGGPSAPRPALVSEHPCGIQERRLLPSGSVLVFVPCRHELSPKHELSPHQLSPEHELTPRPELAPRWPAG